MDELCRCQTGATVAGGIVGSLSANTAQFLAHLINFGVKSLFHAAHLADGVREGADVIT